MFPINLHRICCRRSKVSRHTFGCTKCLIMYDSFTSSSLTNDLSAICTSFNSFFAVFSQFLFSISKNDDASAYIQRSYLISNGMPLLQLQFNSVFNCKKMEQQLLPTFSRPAGGKNSRGFWPEEYYQISNN